MFKKTALFSRDGFPKGQAKSPNSTRPWKTEWAKYLHCGVGAI